MDPTVAALGKVDVQRPDGTALALGELWAEKPTVLVMLRHFG
jgi:hypothetical protein